MTYAEGAPPPLRACGKAGRGPNLNKRATILSSLYVLFAAANFPAFSSKRCSNHSLQYVMYLRTYWLRLPMT